MDGDDRFFNRLYEYYSPLLYKNAFYILKEREISLTVVQDCFMKIWSRKELLKSIENPEAYLFIICKNGCLDQLKKSAIEFVALQKDTEIPSYLFSDNDLHYQETQSRLHYSLGRLTGRQREIYRLSRDEGYSYHDIGNQLNLSPATVKKHMSIILQKLRRHLNSFLFSVLTAMIIALV